MILYYAVLRALDNGEELDREPVYANSREEAREKADAIYFTRHGGYVCTECGYHVEILDWTDVQAANLAAMQMARENVVRIEDAPVDACVIGRLTFDVSELVA